MLVVTGWPTIHTSTTRFASRQGMGLLLLVHIYQEPPGWHRIAPPDGDLVHSPTCAHSGEYRALDGGGHRLFRHWPR